MIAKINKDEKVREYLHRMIDEAFEEVTEDVSVELIDEVGLYRDCNSANERSEFMSAYPYRCLKISVNFLDTVHTDEKAIK